MWRKAAIAFAVFAIVAGASIITLPFWASSLFYSRPAKPVPTGSVIATARRSARTDVDRLFREVHAYLERSSITFFDNGTLDYCYPGRHSWKVDEPFENRCQYLEVRYYGLDGDFRDAMTRLDGALAELGWAPSNIGIRAMLTDYYDPYYGPDKPKPGNFPNQYLVTNIPGVQYLREPFKLIIRYEETDPTGKTYVSAFEDVSLMMDLSYEDAHMVDRRALSQRILDQHRYVLVVGIVTGNYFAN